MKTWPRFNNDGFGYAKGAELYWRDKTFWKDFDYTISYSFLDTKRDYLNFPEELNPDFAAKHTLSIGIKKFFTKRGTGLSLTNSFATGRPYYNFLLNDQQQYYVANAGHTAGYETFDASIYHLTKIGKASAIWYVSATNLLGKQNVSGYTYSFDGQTRQAVMPVARRFYFIGLILNWGVDRRQNAIDNL
ncbi:MAG TPA: hypothetical protein VL053_20555 [Arachidicoccus sp.]|nr:hypothetical protein [Arachidicoccus sp.]